jgi:hypothetical protein
MGSQITRAVGTEREGQDCLLEIPNLKSQISNKFQTPNSNDQKVLLKLGILEIGSYSGFGAWNLVL